MRRLVVALPLAILLLTAGKPPSGVEFREFQRSIDQPVEQQTPGGAIQPDPALWVTNPGPCLWDGDDRLEAQLYDNRWSRGQTATHEECVFGDWTAHLWALNTSTDFALTISLDGIPVASGIGKVCWQGPEYDSSDPRLVPVPGSNGGIADQQTITYTVTALRSVRGGVFVRAGLTRSEFISAWCP